MSDYSWCRDVQRDEAARAAEDGRQGPLPTLADVIAQPFAEAAKCSPSLSETGERESGLRTELVTLEVTHRFADPIARVLLGALDQVLSGRGESVVVMDGSCEITKLTDERDAAIRERDEAKARVAELERSYSAECDARAQAHRELSDLAEAVRERESGEECDHSYAAQCREAAAARDRADRMMPAPAASGNCQGILDGSPAASGAAVLAEIAQAFGCEPDDDADLVEAARLLVRERDDAVAKAASGAAGTATWFAAVGKFGMKNVCMAFNSFEECEKFADGEVRIVPLYAAPQPAKNWLTEDERIAIRWVTDITPIGDEESRKHFTALRKLLARSSRWCCRSRHSPFTPDSTHAMGWWEAIGKVKKALAAAGVTCKEVGSG